MLLVKNFSFTYLDECFWSLSSWNFHTRGIPSLVHAFSNKSVLTNRSILHSTWNFGHPPFHKQQPQIIMLLPPCFTVFFEKFIWNSRNFGWRTFLWASFPNKFVFVSSLQWLLCHFFEPSVTCQILWQKAEFCPIFKVTVPSKDTLRAILPGSFGFSKRRWTVPRDMTLPNLACNRFLWIKGVSFGQCYKAITNGWWSFLRSCARFKRSFCFKSISE